MATLSHINLETAKYAKKEEILLYCLPPHTTHVLQPCDVGFFRPMKNKAVGNHICTQSETVDKYYFARVFKKAWDDTIKLSTLMNSFKGAGICPLNRNAISEDKAQACTVLKPMRNLRWGEQQLQTRDLKRSHTPRI